MAHTKATGGAKRNVDVAGKRLGLKKFGGEYVKAGNIVLRQRGTVFYPGLNTDIGRDHTIFATAEGFVSFRQMTGARRKHQAVDVLPKAAETAALVSKAEKASDAKAEAAPKKVAAKKAEPKAAKAPAKKAASKKEAK